MINDTQNKIVVPLSNGQTTIIDIEDIELTDSQWRAQIWVNKTSITLGYFNTPEEAHEAYKHASTKYFGEFARWE